MAHKMHLWISEMYHALFNGFLEHLDADWPTPSLKLDQAGGKFRLEPCLVIRGDDINLSLRLVSDLLRISQDRARGFCLSIG